MINFKKNQKQFMAIFSVGLMIAFALPSAVSNYSKSREVEVAVAGSKKITNKDLAQAKMEWEALKQIRIERSNPSDPTAGPQAVPIAEVVLGPVKSLELQNNPELYYLLKLEADQMGMTVSQDQVRELLVNRIKSEDDRLTDAELAPALEKFLKVLLASRRASSSLQASTPEIQTALSTLQSFSLNLVEFKAQDYLAKVPAYNEAQKLQRATEQYNAYKDFEPTTRPTNPKTGQPQNDFSFGYRLRAERLTLRDENG